MTFELVTRKYRNRISHSTDLRITFGKLMAEIQQREDTRAEECEGRKKFKRIDEEGAERFAHRLMFEDLNHMQEPFLQGQEILLKLTGEREPGVATHKCAPPRLSGRWWGYRSDLYTLGEGTVRNTIYNLPPVL